MKRVLYPKSGFTLDDAIAYYKRVARWLLPHLKGRPLSFKRYPGTIDDESFWEKDAPSFTPEWVKTFTVPRRSDGTPIHYVVVDDARTLSWIVAAGGIELHPFLHKAADPDCPTAIVFDLDPGRGAAFADCCDVALILRDALSRAGLQSFAKVSGSKGVQLYVPLNGDASHDATETFARLLAEELARRHPKLITAKMGKEHRAKKVFIDWSQNAWYKTTVAVYSLRAKRDEPYVSMPVTWDEVERREALDFSPDDALARLRKHGDRFAPVVTLRQELPFAHRSSTATKPAAAAKRHRTQSGRREYLLVTTNQAGDELWLEGRGMLQRWILRADREGERRLIALHAGEFGFDPANYHGATIRERGTYELIESEENRQVLYFDGQSLRGEWTLEKITPGREHRSWALAPRAKRTSASTRTRGRGSAASRAATTDSARRKRGRVSAAAKTGARKRRTPAASQRRSRRPRS